MEVTLEREPRADYAAIVEDEFLSSRNRGVGIARHFPWLLSPCEGIGYAYLLDGSSLVGGLSIVDCTERMARREPRTSAVGLVCIARNRRGEGLSRLLLSETVRRSRDDGIGALTLWTDKRDVYRRHGFVLADDSLFGWVRAVHRDPQSAMRFIKRPINGRIPAFAAAGYELVSDGYGCSVLEDRHGAILAGWHGTDEQVCELLRVAMPNEWRMNATSDDSLPTSLRARGYVVELVRNKLQMWLSLDPGFTAEALSKSCRFSVLDRV